MGRHALPSPPVTRFLRTIPLLVAALGAAAAAEPLPRPVASALAAAPFRGQGVGVYAIRAENGTVLAAYGADTPLIPASTMKVLTAACALDTLGSGFTFRTRILADHAPDASGTVHGNLYVQGGGDPVFRPEDLWASLTDLAAAGVKRIEGDVVVDDTLFEEPGRPASWPPVKGFPAPYDAPQGALALAWDGTEVVVVAGRRPGEPAQADTAPVSHVARLENGVVTGARTAVQLALVETPGEPPVVRVTGTVARGKPVREWIHLGHPTYAVAGAVVNLLPHAGVTLTGRARRGATPTSAAALVERRSLPLSQVLVPIMKNSSNFGAEMVLRGLAAAGGQHPATTAGGTSKVLACLDRWNVSRAGADVRDGSGFGRGNRLTAKTLVGAIDTARRNATWGPDFVNSLPIASQDGSLRRRLRDMRGRVRAKTGTLDGVHALAGSILTPAGHEVLFAVVLNQRQRGAFLGHPSVDKIVRALAAAADGKDLPAEREPRVRGRKRR